MRRDGATALLGGLLLLLALIFAAAAPAVAPYKPNETDARHIFLPPAWKAAGDARHVLGTDNAGRDILSRIIWGGRVSLGAGVAASLLGALAGGTLGLCAGFSGGFAARAVSWLIDVQSAFPFILLAIFLLAVLGGGFVQVVIVLSLGTWPNFSREVRRLVRALLAQDFVLAARAIGVPMPRLLRRSILPSVLPSVAVVAIFSLAQAILAHAALTFLGVGADPMVPSWGGMLGLGRTYLPAAWWMAAFPGLAIVLSVLGVNLLGEWLSSRLVQHR